jgi:CYTH domain-containing protein
MAYEVERKFLLALPIETWGIERLAASAAEITQGYLTDPGAAMEVRVRRARALALDAAGMATRLVSPEPRDAAIIHWLAIKGTIPTRHEGGLSRHELEVQIDASEFEQAWRLVGRRRLTKVRTSIAVRDRQDRTYEISVDVFGDRLEGLMMAEVEFATWDESVAFSPPGFLGAEVTHDERYRNANLAASDSPPEH